MRIAFANSARIWGGGEVITATLLDGLRARGHEVILLCRKGSAIQNRMTSVVPCFTTLGGFDANPVAVAKTMRVLRRSRTELLVTITPRDPRMAGVAAKLLGVPVVLRQPVRAGFRARFRHRLFYELIPSHYIANSHATRAAMLESASWLDPDTVSVVHNGIDVDRFAGAAPADLGVPVGAIVVGFVGRLETAKGMEELMQAWPIVAAQVRHAHLVIVGNGGNAESRFVQWAVGMPRVHVLGPRRDMPAVMSAIDVLAMPSHNEGFGLAVAEAMAAGAAVVATNAGALQELLDDNVEGRVVPARDAAALAEAIIAVAGNESLRKAMGRAGHARAKRDFDVSRMIDEYERIFETIRNARGSGRQPQ
jgi:glycosyltransferase involved in cell wall biosynthesis